MKWWRTEWKYWYSTSGIKLVSSPFPTPCMYNKDPSARMKEKQTQAAVCANRHHIHASHCPASRRKLHSAVWWRKSQTTCHGVGFGFTFIGNPEQKSYRLMSSCIRNDWWDLCGRPQDSVSVPPRWQQLLRCQCVRRPAEIWVRRAAEVCRQSDLLSALRGSSLAAAGRQTVVQRVAQRLRSLQDLRAAGRQRFLRPLPEKLQPGLTAHLGDARSAVLSPAVHSRLCRDWQAAGVNHTAGGRSAGLHALRRTKFGLNALSRATHLISQKT